MSHLARIACRNFFNVRFLEFFSDGRWRQRKMHSNPAKRWQDQAIEARGQLSELEDKSRRLEEQNRSARSNSHAPILQSVEHGLGTCSTKDILTILSR